MTVDVEELARQIAVRLDPHALMNAADIAAHLRCTPRYVTEQYTKSPGFPKAIHLTGPEERESRPRWLRRDVLAWVESHQEVKRRGGRPRNQ